MDELVVWKLPKSLLLEIEKSFEIQNIEDKELSSLNSICVKRGDREFYCEKWVNGAKISTGPYPSCPANCG